MITVEKFLFEFKGTEGNVIVSHDRKLDDWAVEIVAADDQPDVSLVLKVRGREDFKRFIQHVHELATGMISHDETTRTGPDPEQPEAA